MIVLWPIVATQNYPNKLLKKDSQRVAFHHELIFVIKMVYESILLRCSSLKRALHKN